ncbi:Crp/Fnr family transcriptional regulator [Variovorax sp. H27-G14]|uniref:Crp/Fnr family transcriptional regulator n=1 Tax=Variovorax sp. H27-G14 TaxID=3111914 RepID=UPI0038FCDF75
MYLHPLMAGLPPAERAALARSSRPRSYKRNEPILLTGESTDQIYCVASGLLRVVTPARDHGADVTTEFIRRDDFFFDLSLHEDRYSATQTLIAALPSSVYLLPIATMRGLCTRHPEVALGLLRLAMKRTDMLRVQLKRVSGLSSEDLVRRVLHQLTHLAPAGAGGYDKRITQAVIASYSGLSREVVNKTMRDFESRGLVRREEDGVHVSADNSAPLLEFADSTVFDQG